MKRNFLAVLFLFAAPFVSFASDIPRLGLNLIYSIDKPLCKEIERQISRDPACRPFDNGCSDKDAIEISLDGKITTVFQGLGGSTYDHEATARSTSTTNEDFAVIYLSESQGDRSPRLLQTWKVNAAALNEVLSSSSGPLLGWWSASGSVISSGTSPTPLAELISEEWSPVIAVLGRQYALVRECSGLWVYGGYYGCNRVIKITVKGLENDKPSIPVCLFARGKR